MKFEAISYEHAARLIDRSPWDVSRDAGLLAEAQQAAMETYGNDGCVVGLDIYNVEIEAYGLEILEPSGNGVPAAGNPIFTLVSEVNELELDPSSDGRLPMVLDAAATLAERNPDADIRIPVSGPFTIACHLLGMENMICELFTDPEPTADALMHLAENQVKYVRAAQERGFSVAMFESSVTPPLLSPQLFSDNVLPALERIMSELRDGDGPGPQLIIGGDTIHIYDAIASLSPAYIICPVETDQEAFMAQAGNDRDIEIRVNMSPALFLPGNRDAAMAAAEKAADIAGRYKNTLVGSLLPFEADSSIVQEVSQLIRSM